MTVGVLSQNKKRQEMDMGEIEVKKTELVWPGKYNEDGILRYCQIKPDLAPATRGARILIPDKSIDNV